MSPDPRLSAPERLAAVLEAEAELFREFATQADEQRRALLAGDVAALERLADRADALALRFRMLEEQRGRLEAEVDGDPPPRLARAWDEARRALVGLLREAAVSGTVLDRLGDTFGVRAAAVSGICGTTYLPDGRPREAAAAGGNLSAEG